MFLRRDALRQLQEREEANRRKEAELASLKDISEKQKQEHVVCKDYVSVCRGPLVSCSSRVRILIGGRFCSLCVCVCVCFDRRTARNRGAAAATGERKKVERRRAESSSSRNSTHAHRSGRTCTM